MNVLTQDKLTQPSIEQLRRMGIGAMDDPLGSGIDLSSFYHQLMLASGLNTIIQVNDCETYQDWTENDSGTWDITESNTTTGKRVGTNNIKISSTQACNGTQYVETLLINGSKLIVPSVHGKAQQDWRDTRYLGLWPSNVGAGHFSTAGEALITIVNNGKEQSQVNVQAISDGVHQWFEIDMVDSGWSRDKVESLRIYANVGSGEDLYVDDILRYEISYDRGPLYGCAFPITPGTTLTNNTHCGWTIDGLVALSSANVTSLGMVKLFLNGQPVARDGTALGTGARDVWGWFPGQFMYISRASGVTIPGEGVEVAAAGTVAGVASGFDEKAHAKCLEAAGAANDDIFVLAGTDTSYIS